MTYIDWTLTWSTVLAISTALMALAVAGTAVFAIVQLCNIKKARNSDLLMRLDQIWDSKDYIHSRKMINQYGYGSTPEEASQNLKEAMISFDEANTEEYFIMIRVANFFENLGLLTCKNYLKPKDALELFGGAAKNYWNIFSVWANYARHKRDNPHPDAWVYFEKLALEFPKEKGA